MRRRSMPRVWTRPDAPIPAEPTAPVRQFCSSMKVRLLAPAFVQLSSQDPLRCPLFDRPKRGRKKPHQPALAHCVRVAGLYALRLTALPRVGAANRNSLGHLRWPRSDIDSRKAPLRCRAVRDAAPRKARNDHPQTERNADRRRGRHQHRARHPLLWLFRQNECSMPNRRR
jgi:hypothetical protein